MRRHYASSIAVPREINVVHVQGYGVPCRVEMLDNGTCLGKLRPIAGLWSMRVVFGREGRRRYLWLPSLPPLKFHTNQNAFAPYSIVPTVAIC